LRPSLFRRFSLYAALFFLPLGALGCAGEGEALIAIEVNPLCVVLQPGQSQQFEATIFVDGVEQGVDNAAVTWSVLGGDVLGVVNESGFYTSPDTVPPPAPQVKVIATSKTDAQKSGEATVILSATPSPVPSPCDAPPFS
jgi:hypothetical protein